MTRSIMTLAVMATILAEAHASPATELTLLSRSLMEGPVRCAAFFDGGLVIGTGGGVAVWRPAVGSDDPPFIPIEGEPRDIVMHGATAYIAAGFGGLTAVDVIDPTSPRIVFRKPSAMATHLPVCGRYLYFANQNREIEIFDIRDAQSPRRVGVMGLTGQMVSLESVRELLIVVTASKAFLFQQLPDGSLERIHSMDHRLNAKEALLSEDILYILSAGGEISRWNIFFPDRPEQLPDIDGDGAVGFDVHGGRGILLTKRGKALPFDPLARAGDGRARQRDGGQVNTARPVEIMEERDGGRVRMGSTIGGKRILLWDGFLASLDETEGVSIYEFDGAAAVPAGSMRATGFAVELVADGDLLYVANGRDGVRIGRVDREGRIDWIGHTQTKVARDIAVDGGLLYLADGDAGLKIMDVSDPASPRVIGRVDSPFFHSAIVVRGGRAYVAGGLGGAEIYDVSDPARPSLVWREELSEVRGLDVDGDNLFIADGDEGLRIYSIGGDRPEPVSVLNTNGWNCDCLVSGDMICLADGGEGIKIVEAGDRRKPTVIGELHLNTLTRNIHLRGATLFVAGHSAGIFAVDISDPTMPMVAAYRRSVDDARGVFADDRFVYLASGSGGVYVFSYER